MFDTNIFILNVERRTFAKLEEVLGTLEQIVS